MKITLRQFIRKNAYMKHSMCNIKYQNCRYGGNIIEPILRKKQELIVCLTFLYFVILLTVYKFFTTTHNTKHRLIPSWNIHEHILVMSQISNINIALLVLDITNYIEWQRFNKSTRSSQWFSKVYCNLHCTRFLVSFI